MWRTVVGEGVSPGGERPLEPALVQHESVRVGDLDHVQRRVEAGAQVLVLAEESAEELEGQRADRLVRMRHAEEKGGTTPVTHRQELDRAALGGSSDGLQPGQSGMLLDERAGARAG